MKKLFPFMLSTLFAFQAMAAERPLPPEHAIHISKCIVEVKTNIVKLRFHIWLDDLHKALDLGKQKEGNVSATTLSLPTNHQLTHYLNTHFYLKINSQRTQFTLKGSDYSEDKMAVWVTAEVEFTGTISSISVLNNILMEVYDDQKNIVQVKLPDGAQGYFIFESPSQEERLNL